MKQKECPRRCYEIIHIMNEGQNENRDEVKRGKGKEISSRLIWY